jgi:von Willebrand factor A domain-containing protein 7
VNQIVLRSLGGAGNVTLNSQSPTLPLAVGSLAVGASTSVTLFVNVPSSVSRFSITEGGPVQDSLNRPFNFSTSQIVFAH